MTPSLQSNPQTESASEGSVAVAEKLQQLEITQAYQEDVIESLEKTIAQQHQDIQSLKHKLKLLTEYLQTLRQDVIKNAHEEMPPPHY